jgi:hypothetical protein
LVPYGDRGAGRATAGDSGFALAQPLFDILGKNAEFFAARGSTPGDILLFAFVVTFVPALALLLVELAVGAIDRRAGYVLHLVFVGFLGAVFGVHALKRADLSGTTMLIVGAVLIGAGLALAVWRAAAARWFLTVLAAAPLVFLVVFLFGTPVEHLVFPNSEARAASALVRHPTPVVFLLLDELPTVTLEDANGDIDQGRFPNFARLARSTLWFKNMTTVSSNTTTAVPALLTGKLPSKGSLPVFQDHPNNLFTLLGRRYRMHVVETQTQLCPRRLCKRKQQKAGKRLSSLYSDARTVYLHLIAPPALEQRLPAIAESWADFGADTGKQLEEQASSPKVNLKPSTSGRLRDLTFGSRGSALPARRRRSTTAHPLPAARGSTLNGRVRAIPRAPGRTEEPGGTGLAERAWQRRLLGRPRTGCSAASWTSRTDRALGQSADRRHRGRGR